ncbi:outer membrane protein assembly factor BamE [Pseudophaeobacter sp.]|uniref:outer membrane protein assembly factor BamE n=1 Tax=Pseudophaeobacter sp. TaxID=1971739 RepID=UPI00405855D7
MNAGKDRLKSAVKYAAWALAAVSITACSAIYQKHGYVPTEEQLAEVVVGVDTKDSVAESIGVPSSSGVLNDGGYYYISTLMRTRGAGAAKPVARSLVAVSFDSQDVVSGVERYSLEDGRVIPLERRVTDSSVENKTFLRQLLGNLGSFNPGTLLAE